MSTPTNSPETKATPSQATAASQPPAPKPPGPLAPYWFVITCGLLMALVVGTFVAVRYGHWTPLKLDTKINHPKSTF